MAAPSGATVGIVADPCAQDQASSADYFNLCRYRAANQSLPKASSNRIVFMGDSITQGWIESRPAFFQGDRVDRGISGQTTSQMLGRFYADVIALRPATVHILAGTNDIAGNGGPTDLDAIENNIRSMVELAQAHRIKVVLGTVLPARRFDWRPEIDPIASIQALNAWIRDYARTNRLTLVDYYVALDDGRHGLALSDSGDGVHPTPAGYAKMEAALGAKLDHGRVTP
jgi:acyl-CoA thioesterase-1